MPSSGKPVTVTLTAAQTLPHPGDNSFNAGMQNAYNRAAGKTVTVPAAAVLPTNADLQFQQIVQAAFNAKKGTDSVPQ